MIISDGGHVELELLARLYSVNGAKFPLPSTRPTWFTAQLDELIRGYESRGQYLQMPSFYGTNEIAVLSDYGGSHKGSKFDTYTFLFADFGALRVFDAKVKAIRDRLNLPRSREIAFKDLRSGSIAALVPEFLRAADLIPGLLFTLAVEKTTGSVLSAERDAAKKQLAAAGFVSWCSVDGAERLMRVLHSVAYWLSLLGRTGMKTLWMTDNDDILGRSAYPQEFSEAYTRVLALYLEDPTFAIIGTAKSFEVGVEQPFLHEGVSVADLVAGAVSAQLTELRGIAQNERRYSEVAEILTFLGHQSAFLKKMTFVVQQLPDQSISCGLLNLVSTTRSKDGYTAVEFEDGA